MLPELHAVLGLLESGFQELRVLVVGDLMLDRYVIGEVERISPEAPVPVLRHAQRYERPGGAANVAMNIAGLGCQAFLCGFWGADGEQAELARLLDAAKINTAGVVTSSLPTISKTRIVARTQQVLRLDIESKDPVPQEETDRLLARAIALLPKVHAVILSDYAKGVLTADVCEAIIRAARQAGVLVLVDPKARDLSKYSGATTVCPNLSELSLATGVPAHQTEALLTAARAQMVEHEFGFLTVTMSERADHDSKAGRGLRFSGAGERSVRCFGGRRYGDRNAGGLHGRRAEGGDGGGGGEPGCRDCRGQGGYGADCAA